MRRRKMMSKDACLGSLDSGLRWVVIYSAVRLVHGWGCVVEEDLPSDKLKVLLYDHRGNCLGKTRHEEHPRDRCEFHPSKPRAFECYQKLARG